MRPCLPARKSYLKLTVEAKKGVVRMQLEKSTIYHVECRGWEAMGHVLLNYVSTLIFLSAREIFCLPDEIKVKFV